MLKLILFFIGFLWFAESATKYYDGENRPYEFGFNIEGNQHRHEKKDSKGIIMGEFGFITGEVYHVTVYATDENGNFKIVSMKNIKIGLFSQSTTTQKPKIDFKPIKASKTPTCSSCAIPEKVDKLSSTTEGIKEDEFIKNNPQIKKMMEILTAISKENLGKNTSISNNGKPDNGDAGNVQEYVKKMMGILTKVSDPKFKENEKKFVKLDNNEPSIIKDSLPSRGDEKLSNKEFSELNLKSLENKMKEIIGDLYKFNYTVGFHGHHEIGDRAGKKQGGYYLIGRDGYKRVVDYVANEFGFQPFVKLEKIDVQEVPKEETEKEVGLQGYEFKWFNS